MLGRGINSMLTGPSTAGSLAIETRATGASVLGNPWSRSISGPSYGTTDFTSVNDWGRCGLVPLLKLPKACERCADRAWPAICAGEKPFGNRLVTVMAATVPV